MEDSPHRGSERRHPSDGSRRAPLQTSASHVQRRLGCEGARTLQLGSPFDHARQMTLHVDATMCDPRDDGYFLARTPRDKRDLVTLLIWQLYL